MATITRLICASELQMFLLLEKMAIKALDKTVDAFMSEYTPVVTERYNRLQNVIDSKYNEADSADDNYKRIMHAVPMFFGSKETQKETKQLETIRDNHYTIAMGQGVGLTKKQVAAHTTKKAKVKEAIKPFVSKAALLALAAFAAEDTNVDEKDQVDAVGQSLKQNLEAGDFTIGQIAADITAISGEFGDVRAMTAAVTRTTQFFNDGRLLGAKDSLSTGWQFLTVEDSHTTDICRARNGLILTKTSPLLLTNLPPNHFNCRSDMIPLFTKGIVDSMEWSSVPPIPAGFTKQSRGYLGDLLGGLMG